ncbi:MAG: regulatory protein RecX [Phocaeicola sp.]
MKKEYTTTEALSKAEAYCSGAERCIYDVENKLTDWGVEKQAQQTIIDQLCKERYIDQARYCRAFVRDKYRFNQWGKVKIVQTLRMKQLTHEEINQALFEIDEEEYCGKLLTLLQQKNRTIKAKNSYEHSAKLIRFALGRGYEMKTIQYCLKELNCNHELLE